MRTWDRMGLSITFMIQAYQRLQWHAALSTKQPFAASACDHRLITSTWEASGRDGDPRAVAGLTGSGQVALRGQSPGLRSAAWRSATLPAPDGIGPQ